MRALARRNPTGPGTGLLVAGGLFVAGLFTWALWPKKAAASVVRTGNALDNYLLVVSSPTAMPSTDASVLKSAIQSFPGFQGATVTSAVQSADDKTFTVTFTAPPVTAAALAEWSTMAGPDGSTYTLSDTGIAVQ